jgi:trehalose 6-phosphate phosphatase
MIALSEPPIDLLDGAALFLDFDGTLIELAETPDAIRVAPELGPLLVGCATGLAAGSRSSAAGRSRIWNATFPPMIFPFPGPMGWSCA